MPIEAMISKTDATVIATAYQNTLRDRVLQFLRARALAGFVGGVFTYTTADSTPVALQVRTDLIAAGWSVAVDQPSMTVTIS
jgi:hypothetical protein